MREIINEKTVMQFFIEQTNADSVIFLKGRKEAKEKICELVQNLMEAETMNRKIQIACQLWKLLFAASMSYISPEKQGYDKMFKYYDAYVEFEELIFASDSFYRDHTLHSIWVYFLGEYVRRREEFSQLFEDVREEQRMLDLMQEIFEKIGGTDNEEYIKFQNAAAEVRDILRYDEAARCVAALTHDLGYPLKKIEKINKSMQKVLPYFAVHEANDFAFEYTNIQKNFIDQFLSFLSREQEVSVNTRGSSSEILSKIFKVDENGIFRSIDDNALNLLSEKERQLLKEELSIDVNFSERISPKIAFSNDFEEYRHGIMSAFLLSKNLRAFQRIEYRESENRFAFHEDNARMLTLQQILRAVSLHTSDVLCIKELTCENFLTFIDELEEFSRISRASQNREYVKEFCDTRLYMEDGWLNIEFEFTNATLDNLDPEISFKGRCKRFLALFDIPELSPNLKLRVSCIGRLPNNQNTYTLEIATKHADIRINGESVDIPKYLKSEQYYTKEEYAKL